MTQQVVLKLIYHDDKIRKKVMKTASGHSGVDSISLDSKEMKLTVTGDIDSVSLVSKLRKLCTADILSVGPPKKPAEPAKKEAEPKKPEEKKVNEKDEAAKLFQAWQEFHVKYAYPAAVQPQYYLQTVHEDPHGCVIS